MKQAYIFAGAAGSGRRAVMADLISWSTQFAGDGRKFAVLLPEGEGDVPCEALSGASSVASWDGTGDSARMPDLQDDADVLFILLDGRTDPVDQFENLVEWLRDNPEVELARIVTVINSLLLFEKPALKLWYDALLHFSDVVLFANRDGVPNKWFSDFKQRFVKECYPCMFEIVKDGRVKNPAEVLCPETRRLSQAFDNLDEIPVTNESDNDLPGYVLIDETEDEEDGVVVDEEEEEDIPEPEPYFERDAAGRRKIRLPDIKSSLNLS